MEFMKKKVHLREDVRDVGFEHCLNHNQCPLE